MVFEYLKTFIEYLDKYENVREETIKKYRPFKSMYDEFCRQVCLTRKSDYTEVIFRLDGQCDNLHTSMKAFVNGMRKSEKQETREAAISVWNTLHSLPYRLNDNYLEKRGEAISLIGALTGSERENVEEIGMTSLVMDFKKTHDEIQRLIHLRIYKETEQNRVNFERFRRVVEQSYRDYVVIINAFYVMHKTIEEGFEGYEDLIKLMNVTIADYKRYRPKKHKPKVVEAVVETEEFSGKSEVFS